MKTISLEQLLEAGCHFGHQVTRQNPKARDFVFESRDNIHIIDLAKTKEGLEQAAEFIREVARENGSLLVVGTKRQAQSIVEEEIKRAKEEIKEGDKLYFITNRWIGGILTNFTEVTKNFKKLKDLESKLKDDEEKSKYTKKEIGGWQKERAKLQSFYGGITDMNRLPDALFIVDTHLEHLAVREASRTGVKVAGIVDTNADPTFIDYPIPANDDAVGSVKLIISYILDAWIEGRKNQERAENKESETKKQRSSSSKERAGKQDSEKQTGIGNQKSGEDKKKTSKDSVSKKVKAVKTPKAKTKSKEKKPAEAKNNS